MAPLESPDSVAYYTKSLTMRLKGGQRYNLPMTGVLRKNTVSCAIFDVRATSYILYEEAT